jgi:hypothetical protein
MKFYRFLLGTLTVWRITHFLNAEDGPGDLAVILRRRVGEGFWGKLFDCFNCLSVWVALPFARILGSDWIERAFLWPALSAGAILLQGITSRMVRTVSPAYIEDPPKNDVVLRQTEKPNS